MSKRFIIKKNPCFF